MQTFWKISFLCHEVQSKNGGSLSTSFQLCFYLYLENIERDKGKIEKRIRKTFYQGVYPIPKSKLKQLKKHFIYKMGVMWEEGYEEYDIINIDLIKNQINCLE